MEYDVDYYQDSTTDPPEYNDHQLEPGQGFPPLDGDILPHEGALFPQLRDDLAKERSLSPAGESKGFHRAGSTRVDGRESEKDTRRGDDKKDNRRDETKRHDSPEMWAHTAAILTRMLQLPPMLHLLLNFENCYTSPRFCNLNEEEVCAFLKSDYLNVSDEGVVFQAICHWIESDPVNRKRSVPRLLRSLRLGLLTNEYFVQTVLPHPYIKHNKEAREIVRQTLRFLSGSDHGGTETPDLKPPVARPRIPHDLLFVIGGWNEDRPTNAVETYDSRADSWLQYGHPDKTRRAYHGTASLGTKIYIIGGFDGKKCLNSCRLFDAVTGKWHKAPTMIHKRCYVSVAVHKNHIYAMGGYDGETWKRSVERYDPTRKGWAKVCPMINRRSDAGATTLNDDIYICGGYDGITCLDAVEVYSVSTDQWTALTPMPKKRSGVGVAAYCGCVYVLGGFNGSSRKSKCHKFDPDSQEWCRVPDMYTPRSNFATAVIDNQLFAIGGYSWDGPIPSVECYDLNSDEWLDVTDMNVNRSALSACVVGGLPNVHDYLNGQHRDNSQPQPNAFAMAFNLKNLGAWREPSDICFVRPTPAAAPKCGHMLQEDARVPLSPKSSKRSHRSPPPSPLPSPPLVKRKSSSRSPGAKDSVGTKASATSARSVKKSPSKRGRSHSRSHSRSRSHKSNRPDSKERAKSPTPKQSKAMRAATINPEAAPETFQTSVMARMSKTTTCRPDSGEQETGIVSYQVTPIDPCFRDCQREMQEMSTNVSDRPDLGTILSRVMELGGKDASFLHPLSKAINTGKLDLSFPYRPDKEQAGPAESPTRPRSPLHEKSRLAETEEQQARVPELPRPSKKKSHPSGQKNELLPSRQPAQQHSQQALSNAATARKDTETRLEGKRSTEVPSSGVDPSALRQRLASLSKTVKAAPTVMVQSRNKATPPAASTAKQSRPVTPLPNTTRGATKQNLSNSKAAARRDRKTARAQQKVKNSSKVSDTTSSNISDSISPSKPVYLNPPSSKFTRYSLIPNPTNATSTMPETKPVIKPSYRPGSPKLYTASPAPPKSPSPRPSHPSHIPPWIIKAEPVKGRPRSGRARPISGPVFGRDNHEDCACPGLRSPEISYQWQSAAAARKLGETSVRRGPHMAPKSPASTSLPPMAGDSEVKPINLGADESYHLQQLG